MRRKFHHDELRSGFLFQREIGTVQERSLGYCCGVFYVLFIRRTDCSLISDDCCLKYNSGRTALSVESGAAHLAYSSLGCRFTLNSGLSFASGAVGVLFGELEWEVKLAK